MTSFAQFHPLLTPHFQMDWPNSTALKNLAPFYPKLSLKELALVLNRQMQAIMANRQLIYVVTNRQTQQVCALCTITLKPATLQMQFCAAVLNSREIFDYLSKFLKNNFQINQIFLAKTAFKALPETQKSLLLAALTAEGITGKIK